MGFVMGVGKRKMKLRTGEVDVSHKACKVRAPPTPVLARTIGIAVNIGFCLLHTSSSSSEYQVYHASSTLAWSYMPSLPFRNMDMTRGVGPMEDAVAAGKLHNHSMLSMDIWHW